MATKPTIANARWATDLTNNTAPSSGQRDTGWTTNQIAVSSYFNALGNEAYKWFQYLDDGLLAGSFGLVTAISPSAITGTVNDYAPTDFATAAVVRQDLSAATTLTGLAGGVAGKLILLVNIGDYDLTLAYNSGSSSVANRFHLPLYSDYGLPAFHAAVLYYDGTASRWRLISGTGVSKAGRSTTVGFADAYTVNMAPGGSYNSYLVASGTPWTTTARTTLPTGAVITGVSFHHNNGDASESATVRLVSVSSNGTETSIANAAGATGTGDKTTTLSGLSTEVVSGTTYELYISGSYANSEVYSALVTYTDPV